VPLHTRFQFRRFQDQPLPVSGNQRGENAFCGSKSSAKATQNALL
jgi:hypothetical protein